MPTATLAKLTPAERERRRAKRERLRILHEEYAEFLAAYFDETGGDLRAWVSLRILPITGLMARELEHAGFIEISYGEARPSGSAP
jgi:hypothetical protein